MVSANAWAMESTEIHSSYHDRCITVAPPTSEGETIKVADCGTVEREQWVFEPTLEGAYVIRAAESETCLEVSKGQEPGFQLGDPVVQWGCHRETTQPVSYTHLTLPTKA